MSLVWNLEDGGINTVRVEAYWGLCSHMKLSITDKHVGVEAAEENNINDD